MEIKLTVDDRETLQSLYRLSPEVFVEAWAEAVLQLARGHATGKIGGPFGARIAGSVRQDTHGDTADVYTGGPEGYIGDHVETGGAIKSRNGKMLAIPLPNESTAKYNPRRLFARELTIPLVTIQSKARGRAYLFKAPDPGGKLERPLFVLTRQTKPQRPRPWWPTGDEVATSTSKFFEDNF